MALGVPKPVTRLYNKLIEPGSKAEKVIITLYYHYLKAYVLLKTRWRYRNEDAPLYPFKLLWIDPSKIELRMKDEEFFCRKDHIFPKVVDGKWHLKDTINFEEHRNYIGIKQRLKEGKDWEETKLYKENEDSSQLDYKSKSLNEFKSHLEKIDRLYQNIKENRYQKQENITGTKSTVNRAKKIDYLLKEINEVQVDIGPEGEFILDDGQHRTAIAKILDLDEMPVRVLVRHREWQNKRNQAVKDHKKLDKKYKKHSDIKPLISESNS